MKISTFAVNDKIQCIINEHKHRPGALLPILHAIQKEFEYISADAIQAIAQSTQQTTAEIHGVISFYRHFHTSLAGCYRVEICRAEACQARGGRLLESHAKGKLNIDYHQTTADRNITLDPVYCLGNCACGPNIRIGGRIIGKVDADKFDKTIEELSTYPLNIT